MNAKLRVAAIGLLLVVLAGLVLLVVRPSLNPAHVRPLPLIALAWIAFLAAAVAAAEGPAAGRGRRSSCSAASPSRSAAVSAPPQLSNDLYRYIWDGRVQAAGIDPYAVRARRAAAGRAAG